MRAFLQVIALTIAVFGLNAQPTISLDWAPKAGDDPWSLVVLNEFPDPGDSGADITWDFTDLNVEAITWIVSFNWVDPEVTPFVDSFPDATVAADFGFGGFVSYGYYGETETDYSYYGGGNDFGMDIYLDPQSFKYIEKPYNSIAVDTYEVVYITDFSQPDTVVGTTSYHYDGYGTLKIGDFEVSNAIRVYQEDIQYDSTVAFGITDVLIDSTITYAWVAEGALFPVVQWQRTRLITRTYLNGELLFDDMETDSVFGYWRDYLGTSAISQIANLPELNVTPTLTSGELSVGLGENKAHDYRIFSVTGQLMGSGTLTGPSTNVSVHRLVDGMYILAVEGYRPLKFMKKT